MCLSRLAQDRTQRTRHGTASHSSRIRMTGSQGLGLMVAAAALWATVGVADAGMSDQADLSAAVTGFVRTALGALALAAVAVCLGLPCRLDPATAAFPLAPRSASAFAARPFRFCSFLPFVMTAQGSPSHHADRLPAAAHSCGGCGAAQSAPAGASARPGAGPGCLRRHRAGKRTGQSGGVSLDATGAWLLAGASLAFCG